MPEPEIAWADMLAVLYPRLHATNESSLKWWAAADLRAWANEAIAELARRALVFVRVDTSIATANGQRTYQLPQRHLATLHVACAAKPLLGTDFEHLDALDAAAPVTACGAGESPTRWYEDTLGVHASIGLYPTPAEVEAVTLILSQAPQALSDSVTSVPIPACIQAWVQDYVLAEAWRHRSDFSMPELADHLKEKRGMYLDLYSQYWGAG